MTKGNLKKKLITLGLAVTVMSTLTACGDDTEALKQQVKSLQQQNSELVTARDNLQITEQSVDSSLRYVGGSDIPEFFTVDSQLIFPNVLKIPGTSGGVSDSAVRVGSAFTFAPSNNWLTKVDGASLEFSHPAKIWGSMKSIKLGDTPSEESYKPIIQQFFKGFPKTNITYRSFFLDEYLSGVLASAPITVNKKQHVVNVGFVSRGEDGVLFLFDYEDNKTGIQQELVDTLLTSGGAFNTKIKLD